MSIMFNKKSAGLPVPKNEAGWYNKKRREKWD
jgi:hypothetical protein